MLFTVAPARGIEVCDVIPGPIRRCNTMNPLKVNVKKRWPNRNQICQHSFYIHFMHHLAVLCDFVSVVQLPCCIIYFFITIYFLIIVSSLKMLILWTYTALILAHLFMFI